MSHKKWLRGIAWVLWGLMLLPLFIGALGANPATDDFVFTSITHNTWLDTHSLPHVAKDALSYSLRTWRDWQGTFTGVVLMYLNPAFISATLYPIHAPILLLLWLSAFYFCLRKVLTNRFGVNKKYVAPLYMLITLMQWIFLPTYLEGLYWHNGAWFYTGTQAICFIALTLSLSLGEKGGRWRIAALCLLGIFIGLNNYITAAFTCAAFTLIALTDYASSNKASRRRVLLRWALPLAALFAAVLLSVLAPGNHVRMATDDMYGKADYWFIQSILWTMRDAAGYFYRFTLKTPLLALLLLATPLLWHVVVRSKIDFRAPLRMTLGTFVLLCAMIFPHMFTSGYAGPGRIVDLYHHYVVTAVTLLWVYLVGYFARNHAGVFRFMRSHKAFAPCLSLLALFMTLTLTSFTIASDYTALVREITSGQLLSYRAQTRATFALLEEAGPDDDVTIPAPVIRSVTGSGTGGGDPDSWQNIALASYYRVKSVTVKSDTK